MSEEENRPVYDESWESPVKLYPGSGEGLAVAHQSARESFGHYIREMTWDSVCELLRKHGAR